MNSCILFSGFHLNCILIFFSISFSQKSLDSQFVKYQGKSPFCLANLFFCLILQLVVVCILQCSFLLVFRPLQATTKAQCDFLLSQNKKGKSSVAGGEAACYDATMRGNFAQPSGFQFRAKVAVADFLRQKYCNENLTTFWNKQFLQGYPLLRTEVLSMCGQNASETDCCISTQYCTIGNHRSYPGRTKPSLSLKWKLCAAHFPLNGDSKKLISFDPTEICKTQGFHTYF